MSWLLLLVAAGVVSVPLLPAALASIASRCEDRYWTLDGLPPGPIGALTRRVVGFRSELKRRPLGCRSAADSNDRPPPCLSCVKDLGQFLGLLIMQRLLRSGSR